VPTGKKLGLWTFDDAGQVTKFRHYVDTLAFWRAAGNT
jgi:ketosteroid isomerase-like protein